MLAYWKSFDSRIPRSSPETQKWLEEELQTTDTARLGRVISTPEFALRELSSLSSHCVDFIPLLQTSIGSDKATELFYWLKITQCYVNVSDVMNKLKTAGLSNGQIDGPFHVAHFGTMIPVLSGKIANSILTGYTGQ
jgi:hypothetical protein